MIYRKGEDQSGLQQAANEQKAARKAAPAEVKGEAGLGGGGYPYLSNALIDTSSGTPKSFEYDYSKKKDKDGNRPKVYRQNVPVSGLQVAERATKMLADPTLSKKLSPVKKIGNQKAAFGEAGSGRIKGGVLQQKAPKKKAAGAKDVRAALKSSNISIEEAEGLNKKGLSSPIKKKK